MIALLGTTGRIGGAALQALQSQQLPLRALTRAQADMRDPAALSGALQGASRVLVILPFDLKTFADQTALQHSLLHSLAVVRPEHFVFISDYGAHHSEQTGIPAIFHRFEQRLLGLDSPCTILRSAEHMQNWLRPGAAHFYPPGTPARPFVSALDVGKIAAELLLASAESRILHVEGPRRYEVAELGIPRGDLGRAGLPPVLAQLLEATYTAHGQGLVEVEPGGQVMRGTTTLDQVLKARQ